MTSMSDRQQPGRDNAPPNHNAPSAPSTEESSRNGRHGAERPGDDRSSSSKPALTERERKERWPVG
jgi:hypothetical protein